MERQQSTQDDEEKPGLISGLIGVGRSFFGLALNRIELAMLEIAEVGENAAKCLLIVALALTALWFSIAFFTVLAVFVLWQYWGWLTLLFFGFLFLIITLALTWLAWTFVRDGKLAMSVTIAEIRQDRDTLL
jgi:uncharacterized membrane protein YqjE